VVASSRDVLFKGADVTFRAMRTKKGQFPAMEWLEGLDEGSQGRFERAAQQVEVDIRDGRQSGRTEVVADSEHRLLEIRVTRKGAGRGPHLRMLGLREGNTIWVAAGFKKQTTGCGK